MLVCHAAPVLLGTRAGHRPGTPGSRPPADLSACVRLSFKGPLLPLRVMASSDKVRIKTLLFIFEKVFEISIQDSNSKLQVGLEVRG